MAHSDQRPGLRAHEESLRLPFDELVTALRGVLGVRLVGVIAGVNGASSVSGWANGDSAPSQEDQLRLRQAYRAAALLRERYDPVTIQAWFKGENRSLGKAPALYLREGGAAEAGHDVLAAAKAFAYVG